MTNLHVLIHSNRETLSQQIGVPVSTIRGWHDRQSIPQYYWGAIVDAGVATWDDLRTFTKPRKLAAAAAQKRESA